MKNKILFTCLIAIAFIGCNDADKISKNLTVQAGRWNIDNYRTTITTKQTFLGITTEEDDINEYGDCGYMYFFTNDDGHWIDLRDPDNDIFIEFEWFINEDLQLVIEYDNQDFPFDLPINERDRMVLENVEVIESLADSTTTTTKIEIELLRIE